MEGHRAPAQALSDPDDEGFLRLREVLRRIPVSERTWWRGIAAGRYPRPVKLSPNVDGWSVKAIRRLCAELAEESPST